MTAEEISKLKIYSLRDGRNLIEIIEGKLARQMAIMRSAGHNNDTWPVAEAEHWKLRNQKHRVQNDMAKLVKVSSGQK